MRSSPSTPPTNPNPRQLSCTGGSPDDATRSTQQAESACCRCAQRVSRGVGPRATVSLADRLPGLEGQGEPVVVETERKFAYGGVAGAGVVGVLGQGVGVPEEPLEAGFVPYARGPGRFVDKADGFSA